MSACVCAWTTPRPWFEGFFGVVQNFLPEMIFPLAAIRVSWLNTAPRRGHSLAEQESGPFVYQFRTSGFNLKEGSTPYGLPLYVSILIESAPRRR